MRLVFNLEVPSFYRDDLRAFAKYHKCSLQEALISLSLTSIEVMKKQGVPPYDNSRIS